MWRSRNQLNIEKSEWLGLGRVVADKHSLTVMTHFFWPRVHGNF